MDRTIEDGWQETGPGTGCPISMRGIWRNAPYCLCYDVDQNLNGAGHAVCTVYAVHVANKKGNRPIQKGTVCPYAYKAHDTSPLAPIQSPKFNNDVAFPRRSSTLLCQRSHGLRLSPGLEARSYPFLRSLLPARIYFQGLVGVNDLTEEVISLRREQAGRVRRRICRRQPQFSS